MKSLKNTVALLDAGAQYGKVIDRRVRELNYYSQILPLDTPAKSLSDYGAIIISGGPESVYEPTAPSYDPEIFSLNIPILGICYGMQLINQTHGGEVSKKSTREDGQEKVTITTSSPLFSGLQDSELVLLTHGDSVTKVPDGYEVIAESGNIIAGIQNKSKNIYGVQFHPEVDLTPHGQQIFKNFLGNIANLTAHNTLEQRQTKAIEYIQKRVGDKHVLALLSGGVDSTVLAALLHKALPHKQVHSIHIDTGLMRKGESDLVIKALEDIKVPVTLIQAEATFLKALAHKTDPEEKRHIIGDTFIKIAQEAIDTLGIPVENIYLAQGTLRPDLIESASKLASSSASTIKTHHNDSPAVRILRDKGRVIEPLQEYHKDEVRILGKELGLPDKLIWRHPFPGPGLGIRVLCAKKPYLDNYDETYRQLQSFATDQSSLTLLPIQSVGVQGDGRTYSHVAVLSGKEDWESVKDIAHKIPKSIHSINRVVFAFGKAINAPIKTIIPTTLTKEVLDTLREADNIVMESLFSSKNMSSVAQFPVVLIPIDIDDTHERAIVLRPFITQDFMTGLPAIPGKEIPAHILTDMVQSILKIPGISRVFYDLTGKPPGTTEWE